MVYQGIAFNLSWVAKVGRDRFVDQHVDAFLNTDHPVKKMSRRERIKFFQEAYRVLMSLIPDKKGEE